MLARATFLSAAAHERYSLAKTLLDAVGPTTTLGSEAKVAHASLGIVLEARVNDRFDDVESMLPLYRRRRRLLASGR